jgi:hypothetical protein
MPTKKKTSDLLKGADLVKAIELAGRERASPRTASSTSWRTRHACRRPRYGADEEIEIHIDRTRGTHRPQGPDHRPRCPRSLRPAGAKSVLGELVRRQDTLKLVELMHREKNIPKELIFTGIEAAILLAAQKHYDVGEEDDDIQVTIDRDSGKIVAQRRRTDRSDLLGRIAARPPSST